ncbi:MAG: 2-oxoacid:acceptor oxidoreductase subunit alpha [bacterium]|nr:2-oxoacid:acceptor oxidoreductase subunit alpha [bacterium]
MKDFSFLIGGKAGDGIKQAGHFLAQLFNELGYNIFIYEDYQSLITGGHNFSIVRASDKRILSHKQKVDFAIVFNKDTLEKNQENFKKETIIIYDSDVIQSNDLPKKYKAVAFPMSNVLKESNLPLIVRNAVSLGILAGILKIDFELVKKIIENSVHKKIEENIKVAEIGYKEGLEHKNGFEIEKLKNEPRKILTGNEAIALGAVRAGMKFYFAYPMTPASGILHFLAANEDKFGVKAIHPENEIAVALMAEGAATAGKRAMVGTSGGGFALMVEALSLAGQAEIPIVFVLSQRPGPATGIPTYTSQADLLFSLFAGHGEFLKIVVAPGDVDEAMFLTAMAMNLSWKYQTPAIILSDKHLSESVFSAYYDENKIKIEQPKLWSGKGDYKRYSDEKDGISSLAFLGDKNAIVKATSYEHNEFGITTENSEEAKKMAEKRLRKKITLLKELKGEKTINVLGNKKSKNVLIVWGSTKGAAVEAAENLGIKVIQPMFIEPFPADEIKKELKGAKKIIDIETNATGQMAYILKANGIEVDEKILKYDGRPFIIEKLEEKIKKIIK